MAPELRSHLRLNVKLRQRDAPAATFGAAARPGAAVAPRECEAAVHERGRFDHKLLTQVLEREFQMFEMAGNFVFGDANALREVAGRNRACEQRCAKACTHGGVACPRDGWRSLVHGCRL